MRVVVNDQYLDLPPGQPVMVLVELEGEEMTLRLERRGESLTAVLKVGGMI